MVLIPSLYVSSTSPNARLHAFRNNADFQIIGRPQLPVSTPYQPSPLT